jgi:FKBP-type peptidyl-prolyl cis-trans isomerase 2
MSLIVGCLTSSADEPPSTKNALNRTPEIGDVVKVNYIMRAEGEVGDTTYEEVALASPYSELILSLHSFGFEPLTFVVGSGHVSSDLSIIVRELKVGENKTVVLPAEKTGIGGRRSEFVQVQPRFTIYAVEEAVPTSLFQSSFGIEPEIGGEVSFQYWNATVIEVNEEFTVLRNNPVNGSVFDFPGGNITVEFNETHVTMEFNPRINLTSKTVDGRYVTIIFSNETHMTVDYNHPFAGKALEMEIVLEEISEPIQWNLNLVEAFEKAENEKKPIFLLFTNISCVTCNRIEFETLTHPFVLALKDDLIWVKIDKEIQKDVAREYNVENLPVFIILEDKDEKIRITNFLSPGDMRFMLDGLIKI